MSNEKETIAARFKNWVSGIGWVLFLWGSQMTQEEYWGKIIVQEQGSISISYQAHQFTAKETDPPCCQDHDYVSKASGINCARCGKWYKEPQS